MPTNKQLSRLIRSVCKKAKITTPYQLTLKCGIPPTTAAALFHGTRSPRVETLDKLMDALGWEMVVAFRPKPEIRR